MKNGARAELNYKWWDKNKAKTLKKTGLGKALKEYEKDNPKDIHRCSFTDLKVCSDRLTEVQAVASKAVGACNKKIHGETMAALKTYDGVVKAAKARVEGQLKTFEKDLTALQALGQGNVKKVKAAHKKLNENSKKLVTFTKESVVWKDSPVPARAKLASDLADEILAGKEKMVAIHAIVEFEKKRDQCVNNVYHGWNGEDPCKEFLGTLDKLQDSINTRSAKLQPLAKRLKATATAAAKKA